MDSDGLLDLKCRRALGDMYHAAEHAGNEHSNIFRRSSLVTRDVLDHGLQFGVSFPSLLLDAIDTMLMSNRSFEDFGHEGILQLILDCGVMGWP